MKTINTVNFQIKMAQKKRHGGGFFSNLGKVVGPSAAVIRNSLKRKDQTWNQSALGRSMEGSVLGDAVGIFGKHFGGGRTAEAAERSIQKLEQRLDNSAYTPLDEISDEYLLEFLKGDKAKALHGLATMFKLEPRKVSELLIQWQKERSHYFPNEIK